MSADQPHQKPHHIKGDRGTPKISKHERTQIWMTIGLILFSILAMFLILRSGMKDKAPDAATQPKQTTFQAPQASGKPYIASAPHEYPLRDTSNMSEEEIRLQQEMLQNALKMAEEKRKKLEQRLHSPMIVFDQAPSRGEAKTPAPSASNPTDIFDQATTASKLNQAGSTAQALDNLSTTILQGKTIHGVLETAIDSALPGLVRAIASKDTYSFDGSTLLIPKGSRLIGQYQSQTTLGQSRILVIWTRLIRPDGANITLNSTGTDTLGRAGLSGKIDTHFMERFGASILLSIIDGGLRIAENNANDSDADITLNTSDTLSRSTEIALENSINIKPTIHLPQGTRIQIFVSQDLDFTHVGGYAP